VCSSERSGGEWGHGEKEKQGARWDRTEGGREGRIRWGKKERRIK